MRKSGTPGLKHRTRANGTRAAIWCCPPKALAAGFRPRTLDLSSCPADELPARCQMFWVEALAFTGRQVDPLGYDGRLASLLRLYEMHDASPFRKVKPGTARIYAFYLDRLSRCYGQRLVRALTGLDVHRWHAAWRKAPEGEREHLGEAAMVLTVLKAALGFGQSCGFDDCARLRGMLSTLRLPAPKAREEAPDADEVRRAMEAARRLGRPSAAFAFALQYETAARQYDIVGQWVPLSDPRPSSVLASGSKWIGACWSSIDENMVLTIVPSKTERTTNTNRPKS